MIAFEFITLNNKKIRMLKTVEPGSELYEETCSNRKNAGRYRNPIIDDGLIAQGLVMPLMEEAGRTKTFFEKIVEEDLARYGKPS